MPDGGVTQEEHLTLRNPKLLSKQLAAMAECKGYDPNYNSPFAVEAKAAGKGTRLGGKSDDITVVVAQVQA